jgi:hypothetical protein
MEKWISHYCNDLIDRIGRNTLSASRSSRSLIGSPDGSIFLGRLVVKPLRWIAAYGRVGKRRNYFPKAPHCRSCKWQDCPLLKSFRLGSQLVFPPRGAHGYQNPARACQYGARRAGIKNEVYLDLVRHCFATHLLEAAAPARFAAYAFCSVARFRD